MGMGWGWDALCPPPRPQPGAATSPPGAARSIPGNVPPARSRGGAAAAGLSLWLMSERRGDREKIEGGGGEQKKKSAEPIGEELRWEGTDGPHGRVGLSGHRCYCRPPGAEPGGHTEGTQRAGGPGPAAAAAAASIPWPKRPKRIGACKAFQRWEMGPREPRPMRALCVAAVGKGASAELGPLPPLLLERRSAAGIALRAVPHGVRAFVLPIRVRIRSGLSRARAVGHNRRRWRQVGGWQCPDAARAPRCPPARARPRQCCSCPCRGEGALTSLPQRLCCVSAVNNARFLGLLRGAVNNSLQSCFLPCGSRGVPSSAQAVGAALLPDQKRAAVAKLSARLLSKEPPEMPPVRGGGSSLTLQLRC